ncbi:hypothetical protein ACEUAI_24150, partial [Aeromonas veronii]
STDQQLNNLLYVKSRCKVHAKDPGCQFVFVPKEVTETVNPYFVGQLSQFGGGSSTGGGIGGWYPPRSIGSLSPNSFSYFSISSLMTSTRMWSQPCGGNVGDWGYMCMQVNPYRPLKSLTLRFNNNGQVYTFNNLNSNKEYCACGGSNQFMFMTNYSGTISMTANVQ